MRADYQLKHQLHGRQGSLWERQVDAPTKAKIRQIVKVGGGASVLTALDHTAASAASETEVSREDLYFRFSSGNFAVVGRSSLSYAFRATETADGSRLHLAYREELSEEDDAVAEATLLASLPAGFMDSISTLNLSEDRDWYIVPTLPGVQPIVVQSRDPDICLVQGVDFLAYDGFIALTDNPEEVLPYGVVRIYAAKRAVEPISSFVLSAPTTIRSSKYLTEYARKTQSLGAFRRAAAEYSGLFITQSADVVLDVMQVSESVTVYNMAAAGAVTIDYPHAPLGKHQHLPPGFVVSGRFDVIPAKRNDTSNLRQYAAANWSHGLLLDGILPVNGVRWDGRATVPIDYTHTGDGGKPHLRLHFSAPTQRLEDFWELQRLHERHTGVYLYDALDEPETPSSIDFWDLLQNFYGSQLFLVLLDYHSPQINTRMWRFVTEHRPQSCNALYGWDLGAGYSLMTTDPQGIPLLTEDGLSYFYGNRSIDTEANYFRPDGRGVYIRPNGGFYLRPL